MKSPDEEVAEKIVEVFREKDLLSNTGQKRLLTGLIGGNLKSEDWHLLFDIDRTRKERHDAEQGQ